MKTENLLKYLNKSKQDGQKLFAWLIDPDKLDYDELPKQIQRAESNGVDLIFVGGSLLMKPYQSKCIKTIKDNTGLPVVLFPGSSIQVNEDADAILLLSLISGRNPDLLIGRQVEVAPSLYHSSLEILPTGYMLVDGGKTTTAAYISNSFPIPHHKTDIAVSTAMAGEMLGLKLLYLDTGSGADQAVSEEMIHEVAKYSKIPIIVGGGIKSTEAVRAAHRAGADVVVVGTALENGIDFKDLT